MAWQKFEGSNSFTDTRDTIQGLVGNVTLFNEYEPRGEDRISKVMLWLCLSMRLCCTIFGEYAMYRAVNLASRPNSERDFPLDYGSAYSYVRCRSVPDTCKQLSFGT